MIDLDLMRAELIRDEGCRLVVYDDATGAPIGPRSMVMGHPTIGVGRALDLAGITEAEAAMMLDGDIQHYLVALDALPWFAAMDGARQRAIVNMRHQLGLGGLLDFRRMIACCSRQDWGGAATAGAASRWYGETPARAERVLSLLRDG